MLIKSTLWPLKHLIIKLKVMKVLQTNLNLLIYEMTVAQKAIQFIERIAKKLKQTAMI